jgi:hypothetical protein
MPRRHQCGVNDVHEGSRGQGSRLMIDFHTHPVLIQEFPEKQPSPRLMAGVDIPFAPANSVLAVNEPRT